MSQNNESIQLDQSLERYLEGVSKLHQSKDRLTQSYSELGSTWARVAAALRSLSDRGQDSR